MPTVKVRSIALIRTLIGREQVELSMPEGATIQDVLDRLAEIGDPKLAGYLAEPEEKSAHAPLRIMLNGRDITVLKDRASPVGEGDDVLVFVPIAGG
jgi:molybdopterin converting factor small subunit